MTVAAVPDELYAYTEATTPLTSGLGATAVAARNAITAFNEANADSDVPGSIDDVATLVDDEADLLRDMDRIPASFADAVVALDRDGAADAAGLYVVDPILELFVPAYVETRVEHFFSDPDFVFDLALDSFDAGFAQTFARLRDESPDESIGVVWEAAVEEQAQLDAEELLELVEAGVEPGSDEYDDLAERLALVDQRSDLLYGYAVSLYVDELGEDGIHLVLDEVDVVAYSLDMYDEGELDGVDVRGDLLVPFATGLSVAAASPQATELIGQLTDDADTATIDTRHLAMLVSGAPQPPELLVPAADALLVDAPEQAIVDMSIDRWGSTSMFGPDAPASFEVVVAEALADNPEASAQYAAMGEDQVRSLVYLGDSLYGQGYGDVAPDEDRYIEAAATVLDSAATTGYTGSSPAESVSGDSILQTVVEVSDSDVPDLMKERLAGVAAGHMGSIEDFVAEGGDLRDEVQAFFGELSHNDEAVNLLTLGAMDQYQVDMQEALGQFAGLSPEQQAHLANLNDSLETGTSEGRELLGTLGAGFHDADVAAEQRHAAMLGALNWLGDGAVSVGVASSPLSGGTSALAGIGLNKVVDVGIDIFGDVTAPEETTAADFVDAVEPAVQDLATRVLYDDPEMRAFLTNADAERPDPETISFEEFKELDSVLNVAPHQADAAASGTLLYVLANDLFNH